MNAAQRQVQCELGQSQLMRMDYLRAERTLAAVERSAWEERDLDTLARLYMPLQEARRQRRQRCAEGVVRLDLRGDDVEGILRQFPQGQLLIAGATVEAALAARRLADERGLYVDVLLGRLMPGNFVEIHPLPAGGEPMLLSAAQLAELAAPQGVAELWQRLHLPFLAAAQREADLPRKISLYRTTIEVDYGCELAHQQLSDAARELLRRR